MVYIDYKQDISDIKGLQAQIQYLSRIYLPTGYIYAIHDVEGGLDGTVRVAGRRCHFVVGLKLLGVTKCCCHPHVGHGLPKMEREMSKMDYKTEL
ncbi:hypothetical protein M513_13272 [Trichuris suis]|uniref:Uncharacterized protein n=1 Tax=Trichuris suis TaxID=68888 RepID=A0A085LLL3_9BILA|nr:hypothetical protein M513_13272 [Trichuris suis]